MSHRSALPPPPSRAPPSPSPSAVVRSAKLGLPFSSPSPGRPTVRFASPSRRGNEVLPDLEFNTSESPSAEKADDDTDIVHHRQELQLQLLQSKIGSLQEENVRLKDDIQRAIQRGRDLEALNSRIADKHREEQTRLNEQLSEVQKRYSALQQGVISQEEKSTLECRDYRTRLREAERQLADLRRSLESLQEINTNQAAIIESEASSRKDEEERLKGGFEARLRECDVLRSDLASRLSRAMSIFAEHAQRMEAWHADEDARLAAGAGASQSASDELSNLMKRVDEERTAESDLVHSYHASTTKLLEDVLQEFAQLTTDLSKAEAGFRSCDVDLKTSRIEVERLHEEIRELSAGRVSLAEELRAVKNLSEDSKRAMMEELRKSELIAKDWERRYATMEQTLRSEVENLKSVMDGLKDELTTVREEKGRSEGENAHLRDSLQASDSQREALESDYSTFQEQTKKETDAGEAAVRELREELQTSTQTRDRQLEEKGTEIERLAGDLQRERELVERLQQSLSETAGEGKRVHGSLSRRVKALQEELNVQRGIYVEEINAARLTIDQKARESRELSSQVDDLKAALDANSRDLQELQRRSEESRIQQENVEAERTTLAKRNQVSEMMAAELKESFEAVRRENETLTEKCRKTEADKAGSLSERDTLVRQLQNELAKAHEELSQAQGLLTVVQEHRQSLQQECEKLRHEVGESEQRIRVLQDSTKADVQRVQADSSSLRSEREEAVRLAQRQKDSVAELQRENSELKARTLALQEALRDAAIAKDDEADRMRSSQRSKEASSAILGRELQDSRSENETLRSKGLQNESDLKELRERLQSAQLENQRLVEEEKTHRDMSTAMLQLQSEVGNLRRENERLLASTEDSQRERERQQRAHERSLGEVRERNTQLEAQIRQTQAMLILQQKERAGVASGGGQEGRGATWG